MLKTRIQAFLINIRQSPKNYNYQRVRWADREVK
jgi:hypothetical protein